MRGLAVAAILVGLLVPVRASAVAVQVEVYLVYWPSLGGTANEAELDRFMDCLLAGTNYGQFFSRWGGAAFLWGGSLGLASPPADGHFGACDGDVGYVDNLIDQGALPMPSVGILPLYVFMVPEGLIASNCYDAGSQSCNPWPDCGQLCEDGVCGLNPGETNYDISQPWLEAWVTTYATCCWPSGRTDLNVETAVIEHEVAEAVANAMGGLGTCADGCDATLYPFTGCPSQLGEASNWYELQNLSTLQTGSCDYQVEYTGLGCAGLDEGCQADGNCCAPLVCGASGLSDGGSGCCYPSGERCALSTDCCGGLSCSGERCTGPLDGGRDAGTLGDAGVTVAQGADGGGDGGAPTPPVHARGCSSAGDFPAAGLEFAALALWPLRRRWRSGAKLLASSATEAP